MPSARRMSDDLGRFFGALNARLEEAADDARRRLGQFFAELAPRLETARALERELDRQLAHRFNVFDYLRTDELGLSRFVADLLNPEAKHGQGTAFLRCFLDKVGFEVGGGIDIGGSKVDVELTIENQLRLDIAVEIDKHHCLVIENKPYAGDQPNQVKDYLDWLKRYDKHMLIYLSPTGEGPTAYSTGDADLDEYERLRRFAIMPYYGATDLDDAFNRLRLPVSLADWLADCRRDCDVDRLRLFLREAETFCQTQFGGSAMLKTEHTVKDFVLADNRNMETALAVYESWPGIKKDVCEQFLKEISTRIPEDMLCNSRYGEKVYECRVGAYYDRWKEYQNPDNGEQRRTCIALRAEARGPNHWFFGVVSPLVKSKMEESDKLRRQQIEDELGKKLSGGKTSDRWPWWAWVDEKYRNWDSLIPEMHRELQEEGGEIMRYFVERFTNIINIAAPIIDRIEGDRS